MKREIKIDKAFYIAGDLSTTYEFLKRNPYWKKLDKKENEKNKQSINGYTRVFRNGKMKVFIRSEHP